VTRKNTGNHGKLKDDTDGGVTCTRDRISTKAATWKKMNILDFKNPGHGGLKFTITDSTFMK
jgi:hypothetical protein